MYGRRGRGRAGRRRGPVVDPFVRRHQRSAYRRSVPIAARTRGVQPRIMPSRRDLYVMLRQRGFNRYTANNIMKYV